MATSPSPATTDSTARKRAVTPGTVIAALLVPLMTVGGVAGSLHTEDIESGWAERQREVCRHMPFPTTEYVAAWTGLILGVTAVVVCVLLAKRIRGRYGIRLGETWPGLIAYVGVWFNALTIPMELIQLYAVYSVAGSGIVLGDCG
ncbi:hypothetical protein [Streptomyces sp. ISL-94]|uniref:hypothetical protein n=1 Tax=Streptomyces sp. ISL-94 TaxID=2819190 RepID=UPI001BE89338|nr:hypothetical protein [Streptomyces sp. ISL-94]MBT2483007.1 hypothetical protein [Streptomyces sp. ISL-94]